MVHRLKGKVLYAIKVLSIHHSSDKLVYYRHSFLYVVTEKKNPRIQFSSQFRSVSYLRGYIAPL